jgi:hypothetical protein
VRVGRLPAGLSAASLASPIYKPQLQNRHAPVHESTRWAAIGSPHGVLMRCVAITLRVEAWLNVSPSSVQFLGVSQRKARRGNGLVSLRRSTRCDASGDYFPTVKSVPIRYRNCCKQRTLYQRKEQFLIVNYDCRLTRVYFHVMSLRFLVAATVLFWAAAFLCASDRNSPVPSPPKLSEIR